MTGGLQSPRRPAALVLVVAATISWGFWFWPRAGADSLEQGADGSIAVLEQRIAAGKADAVAWFAYGDALRARGQFHRAARAYQQGLEHEPYHRQAQWNCALLWAQSGAEESLHDFMRDLVIRDAKLGRDLFEHPEFRAYRDLPQFRALVEEARLQAMD